MQKLTKSILKFRNERNWKQFHNQKDMALSLALEAAEVLEHFQWKNGEELEKYIKAHKRDIGEELCDVLYWVLLMSHELRIDLVKAFNEKMVKNARKYPVEKFRGIHS
ncbi:MAG: nucleotide pyrophosphohydrolase [Candidatus Portnoybacteria bacterium]|nr:nucleotide pyrophosphohydrolase [Candidatus Portnoybacteria bacterium]